MQPDLKTRIRFPHVMKPTRKAKVVDELIGQADRLSELAHQGLYGLAMVPQSEGLSKGSGVIDRCEVIHPGGFFTVGRSRSRSWQAAISTTPLFRDSG